MVIDMKVKIHTDGAARGNPNGPGGYGTVIQYVDSKGVVHEREYSKGYKKTTNNRMELMAVIVGLEALNRSCEVIVVSDSKYIVDAFDKKWIDSWLRNNWKNSKKEPVKNKDLWLRLIELAKKHDISFEWIKGHNGHPLNERCDVLATSAADGSDLLDDIINEC